MAFHGGEEGVTNPIIFQTAFSPKIWRSVVEGVVMNPQRSLRQMGYIKSIY